MLFLDETAYMKLLKKKALLPINMEDKKNGSLIYLLTPNIQSSINLINSDLFINKNKSFQSYYVSKDVSYYINSKNYLQESVDNLNPNNIIYENTELEEDNVDYCNYISSIVNSNILEKGFNYEYSMYLQESDKLSTKERNKLPDKKFGLPNERKYPLNDKEHVLLAIKFFNYCEKDKRKELANNIIKAIGYYFDSGEQMDIHVGKNNSFREYWTPPKRVNESAGNKSKVYFIKGISPEKLMKIYDILDFQAYGNTAVKLSTGEAGNPHYLQPDLIKNIVHKVNGTIVECNTAYKGKRNTNEDHMKVIEDHGFTKIANVDIMDSNGEIKIPLGDKANTIEYDLVGKNLEKYDSMVVLTHFKGYAMAGYGGALKNISIGVASRRGKAYIHTAGKSFDQIQFKADDDMEAQLKFLKSLAESAQAVHNYMKNKNGIVYINIMNNLSVDCDCDTHPSKPAMEDVGILASYDPVALDQACIDIIYAAENKPLIKRLESRQGIHTLEHAEYLDFGNRDYEIVDLDVMESRSVEEKGLPYYASYIREDYEMTNEYLRGKNHITIFNDAYLTEDGKNDPQLRKLLFNDRLKNNTNVFEIHKNIKSQCPNIYKTFSDLKLYKGLNLFADLSYYTEVFFKNNFWKADKAIQLYFDFMIRLINDRRYDKYGYKVKTVFIPVSDWNKPGIDICDYKKSLNPISTIIRMTQKSPETVQKALKDFNIIFIGKANYFRVDFSNFTKASTIKFINLINRVLKNDPNTDDIADTEVDSPKAIVYTIANKLEENPKHPIKINNLVGNSTITTADKVAKFKAEKIKNGEIISSDPTVTTKTSTKVTRSTVATAKETPKKIKKEDAEQNKKETKQEKDELLNAIQTAANNNTSVNDAIEDLSSDDRLNQILTKLADEEAESIKLSATRTARITNLNKEFNKKKVNNKSVSDYIKESETTKKIKETPIPVESINEEWEHLKYKNFNNSYDIDADIMRILESFSEKTVPVSVRDIHVEDTSTSEDLIETYTVKCEDGLGQRFTLKFDVPMFVNKKFMKLRGNLKAIQGQLLLLPIIKTDDGVCQIVSNYNKIFVERKNTSTGKSTIHASKIIKLLSKKKYKNIKVTEGNTEKICKKYELPMDYIDIGSVFSKIETNKFIFYFNQDEIRKLYKYDLSKGVPFAYNKTDKVLLYYDGNNGYGSTFSSMLSKIISIDNDDFAEDFDSIKSVNKCTYSSCSILNTDIPTIVVMGYSEGLTKALKKANIRYDFVEKLTKENKNKFAGNTDYIKFKDGYLVYEYDYDSSLLLNGLRECNTDEYSIADINDKNMWVNFLDFFGGRIKADGLDNFYDLMMDPITCTVCEDFELPTDYVEILAYANQLLADNKYNKHVDISGNRFRTNEIIAGYVYKALAASYGTYRNQLKRSKKAPMTIKQSAVIDLVMLDPTMSDASILTPLLEVETTNAVSFKGLSGMNQERSYSLDKRTFDDSMTNILAMSTGFAGNVGITRQSTIDMDVETNRGYLKTGDKKDNMNSVKTLCMTEALTPFGTTHDDPFRTAMTFVQTSKHSMRVKHATPALITNGADEALPYLTTDIFAHKAKLRGKVEKLTDEYMILKYEDGQEEFVDLRERVEKNSDGGFYVTLKLDTDLKEGQTIKPNEIVAYDKSSYSNSVGNPNTIGYNLGTLAKVAIITTDEGYEDSGIVSPWLSTAMSSDIVVKKEKVLPKDTNVLFIAKKGQPIQEGESLLLFQNSFDEDTMNQLLKTLSDEEDEVSDLGRINIKSKNTGVIQDIKVYRTVDIDELSPSLKKIVNTYEKDVKRLKKAASSTINKSIADMEFGSNEKLPPTGKLKDAIDGVKIEFYIKYQDDFSVGDKLVTQSALKATCKDIFPEGKEPYSEFRPDEPIDLFLSTLSVSSRMVCSIEVSGGINKILIELARKVKKIMKVPDNTNIHN